MKSYQKLAVIGLLGAAAFFGGRELAHRGSISPVPIRNVYIPEFNPRESVLHGPDPARQRVVNDIRKELGDVKQLFGYTGDFDHDGKEDVAMIIDRDPNAFTYDMPQHPRYAVVVLEYSPDLKKVFEMSLLPTPKSITINDGRIRIDADRYFTLISSVGDNNYNATSD